MGGSLIFQAITYVILEIYIGDKPKFKCKII